MVCERQSEIIGVGTVETVEPTSAILEAIDNQRPASSSARPSSPTTTSRPSSANFETSTPSSSSTVVATHMPTTLAQPSSSSSNSPGTRRPGGVVLTRGASHTPKPPLIFGAPHHRAKSDAREIVVRDVLRQGNSVIIKWDSDSLALGFKVIYRLFGKSKFEHGPPLEHSEREFRINNVPSQVS